MTVESEKQEEDFGLVGNPIRDARKKVEEAGLDKAEDRINKLIELLHGRERAPIDVAKLKANLVQAKPLATPDGSMLTIPLRPANATGPATPSRTNRGKGIELIHFGRVHQDETRAFASSGTVDDMSVLSPGPLPARGVYFRAAAEREAVLLAGVARSISLSLQEREKKEGKLGDLMKIANDLVGGPGGTKQSAASADMSPFSTKVQAIWDTINKEEITYSALHQAGRDLHSVRANLTGYMAKELEKKSGSGASEPDKGLLGDALTDLPMMGSIPLPGELGQVVGTFRKVGGKLFDVSIKMIWSLNLAMLPAIERAAHRITIESIRGGSLPIYPVWAIPLEKEASKEEELDNLADFGPKDDVLKGDLDKLGADKVNDAVRGAFGDANRAINEKAMVPMALVDFLSRDVKKAPGHRFLDEAFQASTGAATLLGGSEKLGEVAQAAFYSALADEIPGFMEGFVADFIGYVFAVCVEFLRSTYRVLTSYPPKGVVDTEELVAAGSAHVLTHLVDFLTEKVGLDKLLQDLDFTVPKLPANVPGLNWPEGQRLTAAPIAAELKKLLVDKASPYLEPVVGHAMSGLAARLNATREWAGGDVMTMEAHLAQLPSELALMFRDLFGPLWSFITDTCMEVVSDVIGKALGPAGGALGVVGDALGKASGFIADAKQKATEAQRFAKDVQDKAEKLIEEISSIHVANDPQGAQDLVDIGDAYDALKDKATSDPFSKKKGKGSTFDDEVATRDFPANRTRKGKAIAISEAELGKVEPQWDKALRPDPTEDDFEKAQAKGATP
ncbi:MAG: hypothetical protein JNK04_23915 [Myxococcales bacterium]|nr:hypothetical protein [Myxococcales bacterium]